MCLYSKKRFPKIALKNIECYKILRCYKKGEEYVTPYQDVDVDELVILGINNFEAKDKPCIFKTNDGNFMVTSGYIHAYSDEEKAVRIASYSNVANRKFNSSFELRIFKCIIPRGTRYYVGDSNDVCAKKIKFIGLLEDTSYLSPAAKFNKFYIGTI